MLLNIIVLLLVFGGGGGYYGYGRWGSGGGAGVGLVGRTGFVTLCQNSRRWTSCKPLMLWSHPPGSNRRPADYETIPRILNS